MTTTTSASQTASPDCLCVYCTDLGSPEFCRGYAVNKPASQTASADAGEGRDLSKCWVLQRNDQPFAVYGTRAVATVARDLKREEDRIWREDNKHVADVRVFWNVYEADASAFLAALRQTSSEPVAGPDSFSAEGKFFLAVDHLTRMTWRWGESCGIDDVSWDDKGDSYNETCRENHRKARRAVVDAFHAAVAEKTAAPTEPEPAASERVDWLAKIRDLCGYIEDGSHTAFRLSQDDATGNWTAGAGNRWEWGHTPSEAIEKLAALNPQSQEKGE